MELAISNLENQKCREENAGLRTEIKLLREGMHRQVAQVQQLTAEVREKQA